MADVQENLEYLSLKLSEVLDEIGVNDGMIMKRRTCALFRESAIGIRLLIDNDNTPEYLFGSQSEGSTTVGINSDLDMLYCLDTHHVISYWAEWKHGVTNMLMVQDDNTAPGYCLLQRLRDDAPLAVNYVPDDTYHVDAKGRVLMKHTVFEPLFRYLGVERHGPAGHKPQGNNDIEIDYVVAHYCEQWPLEGRPWLHRRSRSGWPSERLKSECESSGCFLVPVGSKVRGLGELEWRISTSLAERYLMFSLNITQLRCYVLMKMLLKTYQAFHDVISSYMCKTVLFHCIEASDPAFWQERNLIYCLHEILRVLYCFIYNKNCPHFIIPENNLMEGRIEAEQQHYLLEVIHYIINNKGRMLLEIEIDALSERLQTKLNILPVRPRELLSGVEIHNRISGQLCHRSAAVILKQFIIQAQHNNNNNVHEAIQKFLGYYVKCNQQYPNFNCLEHAVYKYIAPLLCSAIGSLLASYHKTINRPLTDDVVMWLKLGLNSDVSSGLLKLATVCYSFGCMNVTEKLLRRVDQRYDRNVVMPVSGCHLDMLCNLKQGFRDVADQTQVIGFKPIVSYSVVFMDCEGNIVPDEMMEEYTRSSPEDIHFRGRLDGWMDLAVIDSLPYLYFLQYKTYGRLRKRGEQLTALHKLHQVINQEPHLLHKETALNILGQCMEQENLPNEAFHCYERSLQIRPRNNAANYYMSRLLNR